LENFYRTLRPGGRAIVLVPQGQWAFGKIDVALGHYRRYSHDQLRSRMQETGFVVEQILNFNRISLPGWYLNGKLLGKNTVSPVQLKIFDRFVWVWRVVDKALPWGPTSIIGIARRPA